MFSRVPLGLRAVQVAVDSQDLLGHLGCPHSTCGETHLRNGLRFRCVFSLLLLQVFLTECSVPVCGLPVFILHPFKMAVSAQLYLV